jgi:hypothetical protein
LLENGSLIQVLCRCGFVVTGLLREALSVSKELTNNFHGYAQATNIFHGYALDYIRSSAEKNDS